MTWAQRTALVTGASSGVGRAIAERLGERGAMVFATGRDPARLREVAAHIERGGGAVHTIVADLTSDVDVERVRAAVEELDAGLDVLVHSAGSIAFGDVDAASTDDMDLQLALNLRAPILLTRALLTPLRARWGNVVFINSTAGLTASAGSATYAATKHGLRGLADALRAEVNHDGVRVLSVFLGRTATPMQMSVHSHEGREYRPERLLQPLDVADLIVAVLDLPRTAEVTEIRIRPGLKPDSDPAPRPGARAAASAPPRRTRP